MRYESAKTDRHNVGVSCESQAAADAQARQMDLNFCSYCSDCSDCSRCSGYSGCSDCSGLTKGDARIATPDQAVANLDKVREIILDDQQRLQMSRWHGGDEWVTRTCAEEAVCGTTHCLAGWLQVCSTDPGIRAMDAEQAGFMCAPVASGMFFQPGTRVLDWLRDREYAKSTQEAAP